MCLRPCVHTSSYERDLNRTQRPILRLILEQDAPAGRPMVLAVSAMWWAPQEMNEDGTVLVLPHPTFELTDGWYRVRTEVDEALARAARRRKIRIGTKLVIVGAKVRFDCFPDSISIHWLFIHVFADRER